ncbi:MAG: branched-chain amino acid transport system permease protein, partial [Actinomycetota bacterium]|nr:branched-chain amino acid transport system permease protein [Actinomycetota bacterium]
MATAERRGPNRQSVISALKWGVPLAGLAALLTIGINNNTCPSEGSIWLRYTIFGLRSGAIYAMIALGYTMVYGVLQLLNFAHSEIFMIGTFAGLYTIKGIFRVGPNAHLGPVFLVVV